MITVECKLQGSEASYLKIEESIRIFRFVYNKCLRLWMDWPRDEGKPFNKFTGNYYVTDLRKEFDFCGRFNAESLQVAAERSWKTINNFYRKCKRHIKPVGFPKYKKWSRSFELKKSSGWKILKNGRLKFSNIGIFKLYGTEELYRQGVDKIKRLQIVRKADGYYAQFILDVNRKEDLPVTGNTIGLDLGLTHYYTDSNGVKVDNPRFYRKAEAKIKRLNRLVSKKEKESNNRQKARIKLAKAHLKISRQRKDFLVKLARCVVRSNDLVAIEDLNVQNLIIKRGKSIKDAGWYTFRCWLEYYAKIYNKTLAFVPKQYTSQDCSQCGNRVKKDLSERVHNCGNCGLVLDRDHNAAINILQRGLRQLSTAGQAGINACGDLSTTLDGETCLEQDGSLKQESVIAPCGRD